MAKNLKCPQCDATEYNIERHSDGRYVIRCAKSNTRDHQKIIKLQPDSLQDLR